MENKYIQIHGGDIYRNPEVVDFSVNTNPLGPPASVLDTIRSAAGQVAHYPDMWCEELKKAISQYEGILSEEIICGNGAAELIYAVVQETHPEKALLIAPSFGEYECALETVNARIHYYICEEQYDYQIQEDILEMLWEQYDMIFLCNPGNPVGQTIEKELLIQILDRCREMKTKVILDECFIDFLEQSWRYEIMGEKDQYPNLLVLKAFTKIFCMPGLRLGYAVSTDVDWIGRIRKMLQPWNVSILAQLCGIQVTKDCEKYIEETKEYLKIEKSYMIEGLKASGMQIYGSRANYLFFKGPKGLYRQALNAGMLIRDCQNYRGLLDGYYRVAVRTHQENERLITWLKKL